MKNNKIKIALIDSGVDINNLNLYNKPIVSIKITENNGDFEYENSLIDENGHGTAICGIIFDKCSDIELISIKILNKDLKCTLDKLIEAIKFAIKENVSIINLSLGILDNHTNRMNELVKMCDLASKKGIYIISAYNNFGKKSLPAKLLNVFGVRSGYIYDKYGYSLDLNTMDVICNGKIQKVNSKENSTQYILGNSIACAHFSGILANFMKKFPDNFKDLISAKKFLKEKSLEYTEIQPCYGIWENSNKIVYFPINDETVSMPLKLYKHGFNVVGFYDKRDFYYDFFKYKVNKEIKEVKIYKDLNKALKVADSLFIGDLPFVNYENKEFILNSVIRKALIQKKNVYLKNGISYNEFCIFEKLAKDNGVIFTTTCVYK